MPQTSHHKQFTTVAELHANALLVCVTLENSWILRQGGGFVMAAENKDV